MLSPYRSDTWSYAASESHMLPLRVASGAGHVGRAWHLLRDRMNDVGNGWGIWEERSVLCPSQMPYAVPICLRCAVANCIGKPFATRYRGGCASDQGVIAVVVAVVVVALPPLPG